MVRLDQLQAVAAGEVAQAAGTQYTRYLCHQPWRVRNVFVNMVANDHVKAAVAEWQLHSRCDGKRAPAACIGIARRGSDTGPINIDANRESDTRREGKRDQAMRRTDVEQACMLEADIAEIFEDAHDPCGAAQAPGAVNQSLLGRITHGAGCLPWAD